MNLLKLAINNIIRQKFCYIIIFMVIAIATFGVFAGGIIYFSMSSGLETAKNRIGSDAIIVSKEYASSLKASLFEGTPSTFLMDADILDELEQISSIEGYAGQLFIATLSDASCCDNAVQLIAIEPDDFAVSAWEYTGNTRDLKEDEIVLGSGLGKQVGEEVTYFGKTFKVVSVLDETGMGYDYTGFISKAAAQTFVTSPLYKSNISYKNSQEEISMVVVNLNDQIEKEKAIKEINQKLNGKGAIAYTSENITQSMFDNIKSYKILGIGFEIIIILISVVSVFAILSNNFYKRKREFFSMITIGIGRSFVGKLFLVESLCVSLLACNAGNLFGYFLTSLSHYKIRQFLEITYQKISFLQVGKLFAVSNILILLFVMISIRIIERKMYHEELVTLGE